MPALSSKGKGQSSLEMMVTVAMVLAYTLPIVLLVFSASYVRLEDLSISQGHATTQQIADTINEAYLQGNYSRKSILVHLPANTKNLSISTNQVSLYIITTSGPYHIVDPILANVTPYALIDRSGLIHMTVTINNSRAMIE